MKAIHKRCERWDGFAFTTVEGTADFISELGALLEDAGSKPLETQANVGAEDRDYRDLTMDELQELSKVVSISEVKTLLAYCGTSNEQPVRARLALVRADSNFSTEFEVEGQSQVAVDGVNVWGKREIQARFEGIEQAQKLAEAKSEPHDEELPLWRRVLRHPFISGLGATVFGGIILFLLLH